MQKQFGDYCKYKKTDVGERCDACPNIEAIGGGIVICTPTISDLIFPFIDGFKKEQLLRMFIIFTFGFAIGAVFMSVFGGIL